MVDKQLYKRQLVCLWFSSCWVHDFTSQPLSEYDWQDHFETIWYNLKTSFEVDIREIYEEIDSSLDLLIYDKEGDYKPEIKEFMDQLLPTWLAVYKRN